MIKTLIAPAEFRPLEVEAVKGRPELRIDGAEDDLVLADLVTSAVEAYQDFTQQVLCRSTWDLYLDEFPEDGGPIETPAPLASVTSVGYLDDAGALQTVGESLYKVDTAYPLAGRIFLKYGQTWPAACDEANAVVVRFAAGYENAAAIPQRIKDGLVLKMQELYDGEDRASAYEACWRKHRRVPI